MKKSLAILLSILTIIFLLPLTSCHRHEWYVEHLTERTCSNSGLDLYTCTVCWKTKKRIVPALGGEHSFGAEEFPATCRQIGYTLYTCQRCGYAFEEEYTPIVHTFEEGRCTKCRGHEKGSEGLKFIERGTGYSVAGYFGDSEQVIIPVEYEGKPVYFIENQAFFGNKKLSDIEIPIVVGSVGDSAFEGCTNLRRITLADGIGEIGHRAFYGCKSLERFDFKESATVGDFAFYGCTSLEKAIFGDRTRYIGNECFEGCTSLEKVILSDVLPKVYYNTFYGCKSLKSVKFGSNCTDIGKTAFYGCTSLSEVQLPENLEDIDFLAFGNCTSLKSITFGKKLNSIGIECFRGSGLEEAVFPKESSWEISEGKTLKGSSIDVTNTRLNGLRLSGEYSNYCWKRTNPVTPVTPVKNK